MRSAGTGVGPPHKANAQGRHWDWDWSAHVDGQPEGGHCPGEVYGEKSRGPGAVAGAAPKHKTRGVGGHRMKCSLGISNFLEEKIAVV